MRKILKWLLKSQLDRAKRISFVVYDRKRLGCGTFLNIWEEMLIKLYKEECRDYYNECNTKRKLEGEQIK